MPSNGGDRSGRCAISVEFHWTGAFERHRIEKKQGWEWPRSIRQVQLTWMAVSGLLVAGVAMPAERRLFSQQQVLTLSSSPLKWSNCPKRSYLLGIREAPSAFWVGMRC